MSALPPLVDTHCHLQSGKFAEDREAVLGRALARLDWLVVVGYSLENCPEALALVRDRVYATVGLHPYEAKHAGAAALAALREMAQHPGVVAIGETGLDYFNEYSPRPGQARAFAEQLALAAELKLPAVIHNREADADSYAILAEHTGALPACIMHCFGSDAVFAERCVDLGCYISFAGNVTFPKAEPLREAARAVPLDRLLVETDAPYLAPQPLRGKRSEPQHVEHTARCLAEVKGVSFEELCAATAANALAAYARVSA